MQKVITTAFVLLGVIFCGAMQNMAYAQVKPIMDEAEFWTLIQNVKQQAGAFAKNRVPRLKDKLDGMSFRDIDAFNRRYEAQITRAHQWNLWGAAYLMNGGCSDDCFRYFRDWLISEGKERFEQALADPNSLVSVSQSGEFELESFAYVAVQAYKMKTGRERERTTTLEMSAPGGKQWSETELPKLLPKLAAKFSTK